MANSGRIFGFAAALLFGLGCSFKPLDTVSVRVGIPVPGPDLMRLAEGPEALWNGPYEAQCFALNVMAPDLSPLPGTYRDTNWGGFDPANACNTSYLGANGTLVRRPAGGFPGGGSITLEVFTPKGNNRTLQVLGVRDPVACSQNTDVLGLIQWMNSNGALDHQVLSYGSATGVALNSSINASVNQISPPASATVPTNFVDCGCGIRFSNEDSSSWSGAATIGSTGYLKQKLSPLTISPVHGSRKVSISLSMSRSGSPSGTLNAALYQGDPDASGTVLGSNSFTPISNLPTDGGSPPATMTDFVFNTIIPSASDDLWIKVYGSISPGNVNVYYSPSSVHSIGGGGSAGGYGLNRSILMKLGACVDPPFYP